METTTKTIGATYDGKTFYPDEPLDLKPNTHVQLTLQIPASRSSENGVEDPVEKFFGAISLGHPIGLDNDDIDADLAREYGETHEDQD
jgi:hypothetical protein